MTQGRLRSREAWQPATARKPRIVIVDDHPLVRSGMVEIVTQEGNMEVVGEAGTAAEALSLVLDKKPDLVLVDITLREGSGLELIRQIKASAPSSRVLVVSMHDENLYAERALHAGAMGYVNKQEPPESVVRAIRQVLAGKIRLSDRMSERILHRVVAGEDALDMSPVDRLSDRELEVLHLIGQGMTTRRIAEKLHLSVKTIDTYREHIKTKLNLKTANELIRFAVQWVLEHP